MNWIRRKLGGWLMFVGYRMLPEPTRKGVSLITAVGMEWATSNKNLERALVTQQDGRK